MQKYKYNQKNNRNGYDRIKALTIIIENAW